jgi:hypothetical protein
MVAIGTDDPGSLASVEELSEEDPLPSLNLRLHIAIKVINRLQMVQESQLLMDEEMSLIDFLLDQIVLLNETVLQQGGMVPSIALEFLLQKKLLFPWMWPPSITSNRWKSQIARLLLPKHQLSLLWSWIHSLIASSHLPPSL